MPIRRRSFLSKLPESGRGTSAGTADLKSRLFWALARIAGKKTSKAPAFAQRPLEIHSPIALIIWSMVREGSAQPASPTILAGTPATVTLCGTGFTTTEPAAILAQ